LLDASPNDVTYNLAQIELDITNNRLPDAQKRVARMMEMYPDNFAVNMLQADLLVKLDKPKDASALLDKVIKARPLDPDVWYRAAEVRGQAGQLIEVHQARAEYFALTGDYDQAIQQLGFAKQRASNNFQLAARIDARQQEMITQKRTAEEIM